MICPLRVFDLTFEDFTPQPSSILLPLACSTSIYFYPSGSDLQPESSCPPHFYQKHFSVKMSPAAFLPIPAVFNSSTLFANRIRFHQRCVDQPNQYSPCPRRLVPVSAAESVQSSASASKSSPYVLPSRSIESTYDYIIVGAGAAGCVLANRLSADSSNSVLLIEAGPSKNSFLQNMPVGLPSLLGSEIDSALITQPEPFLDDRRLYFPRGRVVGGSHAISAMLYHRGHPHDYLEWEKVAGSEWSPDAVLPYFVKSQSQRSIEKRRQPHHGKNGPLPVSDLAAVNPMSSAFIDAAIAQGFPPNSDFNDWSKDQNGVGEFQVTQFEGNRATPANSYLDPVRTRRNLSIRSDTIVQRILFESESSQPLAVGIEIIDRMGRHYTIRANKEVILAAGVYASPQLLMLSGIGPSDHLESHGISTIVNNPSVGKNLQDHAAVMLAFHSKNPFQDKFKPTVYYTEQTGKSIPVLLNYLFRGKGPLTTPMCETGAFWRTNPAFQACDLQIRFIPFFSDANPYSSLADFAYGGLNYLRNRASRPAGFAVQLVAARPRSRGYVHLRSPDPRDSVAIHANWMSDEADLKTLVEGIKICRRIAQDNALAPYRGEEQHPGPEITSDDDLAAYVRSTCHTANAMVGTCAMGMSASSVVDPQLQVRGVRGLRIIDSSVMPTLPGGQSGAPTMMIAEKGADLVLEAARRAKALVA